MPGKITSQLEKPIAALAKPSVSDLRILGAYLVQNRMEDMRFAADVAGFAFGHGLAGAARLAGIKNTGGIAKTVSSSINHVVDPLMKKSWSYLSGHQSYEQYLTPTGNNRSLSHYATAAAIAPLLVGGGVLGLSQASRLRKLTLPFVGLSAIGRKASARLAGWGERNVMVPMRNASHAFSGTFGDFSFAHAMQAKGDSTWPGLRKITWVDEEKAASQLNILTKSAGDADGITLRDAASQSDHNVGAHHVLIPTSPWADQAGLEKIPLTPDTIEHFEQLGYAKDRISDLQEHIFNNFRLNGYNPHEAARKINEKKLVIFGPGHNLEGQEGLIELAKLRTAKARQEGRQLFSFEEIDPRIFASSEDRNNYFEYWARYPYERYRTAHGSEDYDDIGHAYRQMYDFTGKEQTKFLPVDKRPYPQEDLGTPYPGEKEIKRFRVLLGIMDEEYLIKSQIKLPSFDWLSIRDTRMTDAIDYAFRHRPDNIGFYPVGNDHLFSGSVYKSGVETPYYSSLIRVLPPKLIGETSVIPKILPNSNIHYLLNSKRPIFIDNMESFAGIPIYSSKSHHTSYRFLRRPLPAEFFYFQPRLQPMGNKYHSLTS